MRGLFDQVVGGDDRGAKWPSSIFMVTAGEPSCGYRFLLSRHELPPPLAAVHTLLQFRNCCRSCNPAAASGFNAAASDASLTLNAAADDALALQT